MGNAHNTEILSYKDVWQQIKDYHKEIEEKRKKNKQNQKPNKKKVARKVFLEYWKPKLKQIREDTENKFNSVYNRIY